MRYVRLEFGPIRSHSLQLSRKRKATATRDLAGLLAAQLLVIEGVGRAARYAVAVKGWNEAKQSQ